MATKTMIKIHTLLMTERGNSDATASETLSLLRRLNGNKPFTSVKFLTDVDTVVAALGPAESTKKKQLGKIVAALDVLKADKSNLYKAAARKYRDLFDDKTEEVAKAVTERAGEKTETEKAKWMDWTDVEARYKVLADNVAVVADKKHLTREEWRVVQAHALLSLYVLMPPRRNKDYHEMYVVRKTDQATDTTRNYYVLSEEKMYFNTFKTAKALGPQIVDVPPALGEILRAFLKRTTLYTETKGNSPGGYPLVCGQSGIHLKAVNAMTYLLADALNKPGAGSNMLRHSYLTHKYGGVSAEMAEDAEAMAHSVGTQATYIRVPTVGGAGVDTVELV